MANAKATKHAKQTMMKIVGSSLILGLEVRENHSQYVFRMENPRKNLRLRHDLQPLATIELAALKCR